MVAHKKRRLLLAMISARLGLEACSLWIRAYAVAMAADFLVPWDIPFLEPLVVCTAATITIWATAAGVRSYVAIQRHGANYIIKHETKRDYIYAVALTYGKLLGIFEHNNKSE